MDLILTIIPAPLAQTAPCILFIFKKKQREKSKQNLATVATLARHLCDNDPRPAESMNEGKESQFSLLSQGVRGPCRTLLHFTAITVIKPQPRGALRRVKYFAHPLSRPEDVAMNLTKKRKEEVMCIKGTG